MLKKLNYIYITILVINYIIININCSLEAKNIYLEKNNYILAAEDNIDTESTVQSEIQKLLPKDLRGDLDVTSPSVNNNINDNATLTQDQQGTGSQTSNIDGTVNNSNNNLPNDSVGKILNVEAENRNGNTILIFSVTKDFSTNVKIINFPFRIIFDVPMPYEWAVPEENFDSPILNKVVSSIRYGNPDNSTFRILTSLKYPININRAFFLPDNENYKFIVDFRQADMLTNLLNSSTVVVPHTKKYYALLEQNVRLEEKKTTDVKRELAINKWIDGYLKNLNYPSPVLQTDSSYKGKKVTVVIDPGHGGKDPGAVNTTDNVTIKEKDIVLSVSNLIANKLLKSPEISVVLTRKGDYFVPLKDRVLWAKKFNADLFVSIHADRAPNIESEGLSVYTLSQTASDAQTQVIATNENKSDIIAGLSDDEDTEVSKIIINLLQRLKINDSVTLAQSILSSISENIKLLPNPLRSAGFIVLQVPETPSILIEMGFLSNDRDAQNLASAQYQQLVADRIAVGIEHYLLSKGKIKQP